MNAILLTHGAGSNRNAPLLVALDREFAAIGWLVERVDLDFRAQGKPNPPRPAEQWRDQDALGVQLEALRGRPGVERVYFGGHSYGGRQGSMLLARKSEAANAALYLGYPLHPPAKPAQLRTDHFPELRVPALFASGNKDEFGTVDEMRAAIAGIPARTELLTVDGARHDLKGGKGETPKRIVDAFAAFVVAEVL